ncbi:hypothetical protein EPN81_01155 [Patescibacteria group bacterium]|nr:MAG: hypothetical protein EPN81_01155 [Patescibacteria group bacterium]
MTLFGTNIDGAFHGHTTGALARKCVEIAPRATHMLGPDDAALLYTAPPEAFVDYYEELYGYEPRVYYPAEPYTDLTQPLDLIQMALREPELLERLAQDGQRFGWHLESFIGSPAVYELARRTGLSVRGFSEDAIKADAVARLNDKALFQHFCHENGIPTPPSTHVTGWQNLIAEAERQFGERGSVMLRRARAAGGLGNCLVNQTTMREAGTSTVREHLRLKLQPHEEWEHEVVLVEPELTIVSSPSVLARASGREIEIIGVIDQVLKGTEYTGGNFPTLESEADAAQLINWTMLYGLTHFIEQGGQGWFDIDFGRLPDGTFVAFESNGRCTGNNHGLAVRRRLMRDHDPRTVHTWSNDALKVAKHTSFQDVLRSVNGALWSPSRGDGVVITIPPQGGSMGYIALATSNERKLELRDAMIAYAASTHQAPHHATAASPEVAASSPA